MRVSLKNRIIILHSEQRTAYEWTRILGFSWGVIKRRMGLGWQAEDIFNKPVRQFHGHHATATYRAWADAKNRTSDPNSCVAEHYVSRNITMCERWKNSFKNFLADMGERPPGLTLERINVDGNYEPGNCKWDTWKRQQNNKRNNHYVTYQGRTKTLMEWSDELGVNYGTLRMRLKKGLTPEEAFTTPVDITQRRAPSSTRSIDVRTETQTSFLP